MTRQTYYDFIGVTPTADVVEIGAACDALYNDRRGRVATSPDPEVVAQANADMRLIEVVRTTLADPVRRDAYDAGLGLKGLVGGVADPTWQRGQAGGVKVPPSRPRPLSDSRPAGQVEGACPSCGAPNPPNTRFCQKCGGVLSAPCPKCGHLVSSSVEFCPNCGVSIADAAREREDQERERQVLASRERARQTAIEPIRVVSEKAHNHMKWGFYCILFFWFASPLLWWQSMKYANQALAMPAVAGDATYRERAKSALTTSRYALFGMAFLFAFGVVLGVLSVLVELAAGRN